MLDIFELNVNLVEGEEFVWELPQIDINPNREGPAYLILLEGIEADNIEGDNFVIQGPRIEGTNQEANFLNTEKTKAAAFLAMPTAEEPSKFRLIMRSRVSRRIRITLIRAASWIRQKLPNWNCELCKQLVKILLRILILVVSTAIESPDLNTILVAIHLRTVLIPRQIDDFIKLAGLRNFWEDLLGVLRGMMNAAGLPSDIPHAACKQLKYCD